MLTLAQAASPPSTTDGSDGALRKVRAPLDALTHWFDHLLQRVFHAGDTTLWAAHLLVTVLLTLIGAWLAALLARRLGRRLSASGRSFLGDLLVRSAPTLRWVVLLGGLANSVEEAWPAGKGPARWLSGALFVLAVVVGTRGVIRVVRALLELGLKPALEDAPAGDTDAPMARSRNAQVLVPLLQRLISIVLWLCGFLIVLDHFDQKVSSVLTALGLTSLAIGLAAQHTLSNLIAGLVLSMDHPFRVGDRIRLATNDIGEVLEIGIRSTQIRLADGSTLVVPNADLVSSRVINFSNDQAVRAEVRVTVPASIDLEKFTAGLEAAAQAIVPKELLVAAHPPRLHLITVAEKLELSLIVWMIREADVPAIEEKLRRAALKHAIATVPVPSTPAPVQIVTTGATQLISTPERSGPAVSAQPGSAAGQSGPTSGSSATATAPKPAP